jgi:cytochrome c5
VIPVSSHDSSQSHDQSFFNVFMVVMGVLIGITFFLILLARAIGGDPQLGWVKEEPGYLAAIDARLRPVGRVALPGDELEQAAPVAEAVPAPAAAKLTGEQVYNAACFACHGAGVGGAPKMGDAAAWKPRVAQGSATLNKHAVEGYQGSAGYMPPKGGRVDLSDDEIIAAVDFMVGKSG